MTIYMVQVVFEGNVKYRYFDTCWAVLAAAEKRRDQLLEMLKAQGNDSSLVRIITGQVEDIALVEKPAQD